MKRVSGVLVLSLLSALLNGCGGDADVEDVAGVYRFERHAGLEAIGADPDNDFAGMLQGFLGSMETSELTLRADGSYAWTQEALPPEVGRWRIEGDRLFLEREGKTQMPSHAFGLRVRNGTLVWDPADLWPDEGIATDVEPLVLRKR
jgi:hypothetical protein